MSRIPMIARLLFGLVFTVFGFIGLLGPQQELGGAAGEFISAIRATSYFWPLLKVTEIVCGLLLLTGFWVPLALVVLAPIVVNIAAFHFFMAPQGIPIAVIVLALEIYLAWTYRKNWAGVLEMSANPD